jgi:hypothetical protein
MKYNHEVKVFALKEAKKVLWDGDPDNEAGKEEFICVALRYVANKYPTAWVDAFEMRGIISERLDGCHTLQCWLQEKGVNMSLVTSQQLQQHRHAWVNKLIEEFSS